MVNIHVDLLLIQFLTFRFFLSQIVRAQQCTALPLMKNDILQEKNRKVGIITRQENKNITRTKKNGKWEIYGNEIFRKREYNKKKKTTGMKNSCKYFCYRMSRQHPEYFYKTLLRITGDCCEGYGPALIRIVMFVLRVTGTQNS